MGICKVKIALIVGHNARSQGAIRATDKRTEFDWCGSLAASIMACAPAQYSIFRRPHDAGGYAAEILRTYGQISRKEYGATIELHFNGGVAGATGTETLTSGSIGSLRLARLVQPAMVQALGLRDRGLKTLGRNDRGGLSLWAGAPPAVLIEPYFGSNASDCVAADRNFSALAGAIHAAATAYLKGV